MMPPHSTIPGIDAVFVLTVKTFTDRIEHIKHELNKHNIAFEFIFDHDIPDVSDALTTQVFGPDPKIQAPHRSLVLKHIESWKRCVKNNYKTILVLEDDVVLNKNFKQEITKVLERVNQLGDAYHVFLGGADTRVPPDFHLCKDVVFPLANATTDGNLMDYKACQLRLDYLKQHYAELPADHLIKMIDSLSNITQYWSTKALVEQGSVFGMFTSTLDNKRKRQSLSYNTLRYHWKIFQRRTLPAFFYRTRKLIFRF